ncbi:WD40 repeat-like protein [Aulographum hederae CBS 113979]|uniref:WD40 repeat-like protein n=1 Tax=Aulographum hederae CBS 113979 TaxID=1176131 RepID=A0A6G1HBL6_9PEZI|nr:WD40 repeat-like protein [Aulographum hederae CBS 113979]
MKASPLLIAWHNENNPIYSAHFEPNGKGRLATAGGDSNVRLWKVEADKEDRKVTYLSTLTKHSQTVNVVRWCPKGEVLGSAGDDGNVLIWVPSENQSHHSTFGENGLEDKETWRVKHMCRSLGSEIYDMAWSPDGTYFITGSMDNVARIYNAQTGQVLRQIAEHNHYVQGVAWDPLNEYVATQSSDRSVHIYTLKTKDGKFSLDPHNKISRMDLPNRRISSSSPAPPDFSSRAQFVEGSNLAVGSPVPSMPGTPQSLALPMNPPRTSHSRRSSFGSSPSMRRSASPAPSMPLPAVMPSVSPNISAALSGTLQSGLGNRNIYQNESLASFFRRLTFTPDGALLLTPAGQYKQHAPQTSDASKSEEIINTVYIYTRANLNKPPATFLPGQKKPSLAVRCSPVYYTLRQNDIATKQITIDTSSADDEIPALPEPALPSKMPASHSSMDPPPFTSAPSPSPSMAAASPKTVDPKQPTSATSEGPNEPPMSAFALPYRMVYAIATQDAVHVHDTQQREPLCVVSNLHYATFTDLTWSTDGLTLLMSSSDGFCSCLTFGQGELGEIYRGPTPTSSSQNTHAQASPRHNHPAPTSINSTLANSAISSNHSTPTPTPTQTSAPPPLKQQPAPSGSASGPSTANPFPASPSSFTPVRPVSPARSMSASSIATQSSFQPLGTARGATPGADLINPSGGAGTYVMNNPTPSLGAVPSVAAAQSGPVLGGPMPLWTPPETPMSSGIGGGSGYVSAGGDGGRGRHSASSSVSGAVGQAIASVEDEGGNGESLAKAGLKREREKEGGEVEEGENGEKKRRVMPMLIPEEKST